MGVLVYNDVIVGTGCFCGLRGLEKAGFQYEGTLRKNAVKNGRIIDMKMYSLIRD